LGNEKPSLLAQITRKIEDTPVVLSSETELRGQQIKWGIPYRADIRLIQFSI
jgi:hypothetical protein